MIIEITETTKRTLWAHRDDAGFLEALDILERKAEALLHSARDAMQAGPERDARLSESRALAQAAREIRQLIQEQQEKEVTPEQPTAGDGEASGLW